MDKEQIVELITKELRDPCLKEHSIHKSEGTIAVTYWMNCADERIFKQEFDLSASMQDIQQWQALCMMQHRLDRAPEAIAESLISDHPVILLEGDESPFAATLHGDIRHIMNKWSVENGANVPDNILATFVLDCIKGLNTAVRRQNAFFGFEPFKDRDAVHEAPMEHLRPTLCARDHHKGISCPSPNCSWNI